MESTFWNTSDEGDKEKDTELLHVSAVDSLRQLLLPLCVCACSACVHQLTPNPLKKKSNLHITVSQMLHSATQSYIHTHIDTHTYTHRALQLCLIDTLITDEMPLVLPYLVLFSFNKFQQVHCRTINLFHGAVVQLAFGKASYYTPTIKRYGSWWFWIFFLMNFELRPLNYIISLR